MKFVVFYSSPTCGNCRMMLPWVKSLVPDAIYRLVEDGDKIAETRNLMAMPTIMVVDEDSNELARLSGGQPQANVKQFLDTHYFK